MTARDDSTTFITRGRRLSLYDWNGATEVQWRLPVTPVGEIAWDGEALWVLHSGPDSARTDATLLSRFTVPEELR
jgi:hypothetical protein